MFFTSSIYSWPLLQWFQTWGTCTPMQKYYRGYLTERGGGKSKNTHTHTQSAKPLNSSVK